MKNSRMITAKCGNVVLEVEVVLDDMTANRLDEHVNTLKKIMTMEYMNENYPHELTKRLTEEKLRVSLQDALIQIRRIRLELKRRDKKGRP